MDERGKEGEETKKKRMQKVSRLTKPKRKKDSSSGGGDTETVLGRPTSPTPTRYVVAWGRREQTRS